MLFAGWNWSEATVHRKQAAEYRAKKAALDTREHALAEDHDWWFLCRPLHYLPGRGRQSDFGGGRCA